MRQLFLRLLRWVCPDLRVGHVVQVPLEKLWASGIQILFLDLDNTLTPLGGTEVSPQIQDWLKRAKEIGFEVIIVTNESRTRRIRQIAKALGVQGIGAAGKPRRFVFRTILDRRGLTPSQAAVVGDQLFTDILGGKRTGMLTVLVEPLTHRRFLTGRLQRPFELLALKLMYRWGMLSSH